MCIWRIAKSWGLGERWDAVCALGFWDRGDKSRQVLRTGVYVLEERHWEENRG